MPPSAAELSSLATALEELTRRIGALAGTGTSDEDDLGHELIDIVRVLEGAQRRLEKARQLAA
jgi:hypothetical protein